MTRVGKLAHPSDAARTKSRRNLPYGSNMPPLDRDDFECVDRIDNKPIKTLDEKATATDVQVGGDHYVEMPIQPVDFIVANGLNYLEGNVIKYVTRHCFKNGKEDLQKAKHYIDMLIEKTYDT